MRRLRRRWHAADRDSAAPASETPSVIALGDGTLAGGPFPVALVAASPPVAPVALVAPAAPVAAVPHPMAGPPPLDDDYDYEEVWAPLDDNVYDDDDFEQMFAAFNPDSNEDNVDSDDL